MSSGAAVVPQTRMSDCSGDYFDDITLAFFMDLSASKFSQYFMSLSGRISLHNYCTCGQKHS